MSRYHSSKISGSRQWGVFATAKEQQVQIGKRTTLHVRDAFLYIYQPLLHDYDMKLPNFMRPLYQQVNTAKKNLFSFSFSKPRYDPYGFNPENFANI